MFSRRPTWLTLVLIPAAVSCLSDGSEDAASCHSGQCDASASDIADAEEDLDSDVDAVPEYVTADDCLTGQDLTADSVDIQSCPNLPAVPADVAFGSSGQMVGLGAWELGKTAEGDVYKYGSLSTTDGTTVLNYSGGSTTVDEINVECWAKGYYRLRAILQDPPESYQVLRQAGYQYRFFQFQTDLRNGTTGYRQISSYQDHLIKWVTVVGEDGSCDEPTLPEFLQYVDAELERRGLTPDSDS